MNKSLLVVVAAAVAALGLWLGLQSRQAPEPLEPMATEPEIEPEVEELLAEPEPEPETEDLLTEPEATEDDAEDLLVDPEATEPEVDETEPQDAPLPGDDAALEEEPGVEELLDDVTDEAQETVEEAVDGTVDSFTETVDDMTQDVLGDDDAAQPDGAAVEDALDDAEQDLSEEGAEETVEAIDEALEVQELGLDLSTDAIRSRIEAAGLSMTDRTIIEGLLEAAGNDPEMLEQVMERLNAMTGN
ncbi:MAG: hypothetical protein JJU09_04750 [Rhodobacteraceae bacterium]|nr:hypothetical protein [Paracoccaceae bacterium]TVR46494.1 MAG: hypothetical protein EA386_09775 [Paracoccaceae bacterium]